MSKNALRQLKKYPRFYLLRATFGYGLFAHEGKHKGSGMGSFYPDTGDLTLFGIDNFNKRGGMAYWKYGQHERFKMNLEELDAVAVWREGERTTHRRMAR